MRTIIFVSMSIAMLACGANDPAPLTREVPVGGVGEACNSASDCRDGLTCGEERVCEPSPARDEGELCSLSGECLEGLFCAADGLCQPAGEVTEGSACGDSSDCLPGLFCRATGLSGLCTLAGEGDIGDPCQSTADCLAGLGCGAPSQDAGRTCLPGSQGGFPLPFPGVECAATDEGPLRMLFEVGGDSEGQFYALPFPNDIRTSSGRPILAGHPSPGDQALGFDIVQTYLETISGQQQGFGLNQTTFVRFSSRIDFESLDTGSDAPSHYLVDISQGSPEYAQLQPIYWQTSTGRGRYICQNWLGARTSWGRPLEAETTYAFIVTTKILGEDGQTLQRDADFAAMLETSAPSDGRLADAWAAYQPLRDYLVDQSIDSATIAGASVFTTGDPRQTVSQLRGAVRESGVPELSALTRCEDGTISPCDDLLGEGESQRGCRGVSESFDELHAQLSLPIFQEGEAPYLESGGSIALGGSGPEIQRTESVCTGITVPKTEMPEEGWPVLVFAHGTGGSFRSHVGSISGVVSQMQVGETTTGMIVVGWDQVQHFNRRGGSDLDPDSLVFNYLNPGATKGNFMQGAADLYALVSFVESLDVAADDSPTGAAIKADPSRIYFMGHSQGGTSGSLALPFESSIKAAILSGTGASLTLGLLEKTSPINAPDGVRLALQDPAIGEAHPVLSLIQGFFDPVDPVNYAQYIGSRQIEGLTTPRHVLQTIGVGDTFTGPQSLEIMATALRSSVVGPLVEDFQTRTIEAVEAPVTANKRVGEDLYTVISRQYAPDGYDGHFVAFRSEEATDDIVEFLSTAISEGLPTIAD